MWFVGRDVRDVHCSFRGDGTGVVRMATAWRQLNRARTASAAQLVDGAYPITGHSKAPVLHEAGGEVHAKHGEGGDCTNN